MHSLPLDYAERTYAGVLGKIIGVYLGRPFEQWSFDAIMERLGEVDYYVHDRLGVPLVVTDDDISGTFTFLRALQDHGYDPALTPAQIGETWLNYIIENRTILWWGGIGASTEHTAFLRLSNGIPAPESGSIRRNGKTVAEQIGSQIFIDGWGMIHPGDPCAAADFARRAASVSHDGEAIYGAQVIAAMEALAFVESDIDRLIDGALATIPADSILARMIADVRDWHASGLDWKSGFRKIEAEYGYARYGGGCHMIPNHAVILHALLHGAGDFNRSMRIVNTLGYDTDCNSGNLGCLLGIRNGLAAFDGPLDWRGPVADRLYLPTADGGRAITDAVRETVEIVNAGRALAGRSPWLPKDGARFHFGFPGSVQGFAGEGVDIANVGRMLAIPGRGVRRVSTPTFVPPDMRTVSGYRLVASPTLYSGQTVRACVVAKAAATVALCAHRYDRQDGLERICAEPEAFAVGETKELAWTIPESDGFPYASVGIEVDGGEVALDWLTWEGSPNTTFRKTEGGSAWRDAWVDGLDHFEKWGEPFRLIQDRGTGLLIQGCREWGDYEASSDVTLHLVERGGIAARVQGMRRWIALLLCRDGYARLVKSNEGETILAEVPFPWEFGETHTLTLRVVGDRFAGSIDGALLLTATDPDFTGGAAGFVVTEGRIGAQAMTVRPA